MEPKTYAAAGVDVHKAESFVERLKAMSLRPQHQKLWKGAGGYASIFPVTSEIGIALTTDGVGTKLLVADQLKRFDTIGIDLVAMCANDLVCVGAVPELFLDYFAVGELEDSVADQIMKGIVAGCDQAEMVLAGGETAEMPGLYQPGHFDLAGFAVGTVTRATLLTGSQIAAGQVLIGVASSGIHSNGLSLARKIIATDDPFYNDLLTPTLIYVSPLKRLLSELPGSIAGIAHITGGGWRNIFRLNDHMGFQIDAPLPVPAIFDRLGKSVPKEELYKTFNMGMGLCVIAASDANKIVDVFKQHGFTASIIGAVTDNARTLRLGTELAIKDQDA